MQASSDTFSEPGCHEYTFKPGVYYILVYGAQGGNCSSTVPYGGYSSGVLRITNSITCYLYIGGKGITKKDKKEAVPGGENGGGNGYVGENGECGGSGGGMSDIRLNKDSPESIIIAAGGGGGDGYHEGNTYSGGKGGGINGFDGKCGDHDPIIAGKAGSLKGPGNGGKYDGKNSQGQQTYRTCDAGNGDKFLGGNSCTTAKGSSGGGGGGYYGGGGGADIAGGGGGSGFISSFLIFGKTGTSSHIGNGEISIIPKFNFGSCRESGVYIFSLFTSVFIFCNLK